MRRFNRFANVLIVIFMALFIAQGTEIEGVVRLTGTSLFPSIVISTQDGKDYYVDDELFEQFAELQHRTVVLNVTKLEEETWELADGSTTFIRPTIYEAEILEVK